MTTPQLSPAAGAKLALRDQLQTGRSRLSLAEIGERARARTEHLLAAPEVRRAATVGCYVSVAKEPGTSDLLDRLAALGKRVLLPVVLPGLDLDWAPYAGPASLAPARRGLLEPTTSPLGRESVATADALLVPGLAVDRHGHRLGQGGGCYDRALARVPVGTFVCALVNASEVLDALPVEPHDRTVTAAATEDGLVRF